jgi:hypothetical protein
MAAGAQWCACFAARAALPCRQKVNNSAFEWAQLQCMVLPGWLQCAQRGAAAATVRRGGQIPLQAVLAAATAVTAGLSCDRELAGRTVR